MTPERWLRAQHAKAAFASLGFEKCGELIAEAHRDAVRQAMTVSDAPDRYWGAPTRKAWYADFQKHLNLIESLKKTERPD